MSCDCNEDRVELVIKQGEQRSYIFNITDREGNPVNLSGCTIEIQVKNYPLYKVKSLIEIILSQANTENGYINNVDGGQFTLIITEEQSSSLPPKDYYLIITLIKSDSRIIISGEGSSSGILVVNRQ